MADHSCGPRALGGRRFGQCQAGTGRHSTVLSGILIFILELSDGPVQGWDLGEGTLELEMLWAVASEYLQSKAAPLVSSILLSFSCGFWKTKTPKTIGKTSWFWCTPLLSYSKVQTKVHTSNCKPKDFRGSRTKLCSEVWCGAPKAAAAAHPGKCLFPVFCAMFVLGESPVCFRRVA